MKTTPAIEQLRAFCEVCARHERIVLAETTSLDKMVALRAKWREITGKPLSVDESVTLEAKRRALAELNTSV